MYKKNSATILIKQSKLNILPNPADNNFKIEFSELKGNGKNKLIIYNSIGSKEKEIEIQEGQTDLFINSIEFSEGVYMLTLVSDNIIIDKAKVLIIH